MTWANRFPRPVRDEEHQTEEEYEALMKAYEDAEDRYADEYVDRHYDD